MTPRLQHRDFVPNPQRALLRTRHQLHAQTARVPPRTFIHRPKAADRPIWLRGMFLARHLVDVGHLAAGRAAGDVVFVPADLDAAPGVFEVGVGAGDWERCRLASGLWMEGEKGKGEHTD
jgi:hypothetical protein